MAGRRSTEFSLRIRKILLERGLTPGTREYEHARGSLRWQLNNDHQRQIKRASDRRRREIINKRNRERYRKDPSVRQANIDRHKRYWLDPEYRERSNQKRKEWAIAHRDRERENHRRQYRERISRKKRTIERRRSYNPSFGLRRAIKDFRGGR